ncbi:MAG TPA: type IV pilus secretin PilQ [Desulfovibrio sp.]|jgi:Type II secretory pathway, component HofQ|uniref:type IV pilus secretin PilQ n=1 Tax=Desulfovibrio TaxID=872 RepID=UPI0003F5729E|nr:MULTISPECIES: type IV pilus secretin PilQ [Desulfovibrio]MDY0305261.1 type IV pilus secretin PilQ [Desulfovibrionaceae bacterium]HMM37477.1 type IV pilus secretin PilQ [Desulfovibrio sp.]
MGFFIRHRVLRAAALLLCLLPLACAEKKAPETDPGMDKYKVMAEQSQGHSVPKSAGVDPERREVVHQQKIVARPTEETERPLPTVKVSLRMHNADVVALLQALARAARQSIVVSPKVEGAVSVNIQDMPWDQVFRGVLRSNKLAFAWEGDIIRVMTLEDMESDLQFDVLRKKRLTERLSMEKTSPLTTSVIKVKFADVKNLKDSLEKFLTKDPEGKVLGSIDVDANTNSVIVQTIATDQDKFLRLVENLDRPRSQIKLRAYIVETTQDTARALGVQWGGSFAGDVRSGNKAWVVPGGSNTSATDPQKGGAKYNLGTGMSGLGYGLDFTPSNYPKQGGTGATALGLMFGKIGGNILELQLKALQDEGKLNIISSPSITTLDNQKAYTESGERVPYQTIEGTGADQTTSVEFQDVVLRLEITPHIIDADFLKLAVLIKKDEVDTSREVDGNPFIIKKQTETTLIARDGETVVISGLSKQRTSKASAGVPGLKNAPGVGWLFGSKESTETLDEYLIFITPEVLAEWRPGEIQKTLSEIERELEDKRRREAAEIEAASGARPTEARQ